MARHATQVGSKAVTYSHETNNPATMHQEFITICGKKKKNMGVSGVKKNMWISGVERNMWLSGVKKTRGKWGGKKHVVKWGEKNKG